MEVFDVKYGKQTVTAEKSGKYTRVNLPARFGDRGGIYNESISRDERGYRFTSTIDDDIDYYFHLWLKDNGCIAWTNDMQYDVKEIREPFNPNYPNAGVLNDTALSLYEVVEQIKAFEAKGLPTEEAVKLRKDNLMAVLKLLGYESTDQIGQAPDDSTGYLALNFLAKQLQQRPYPQVGRYARKVGMSGDEMIVKADVRDDVALAEFLRQKAMLEANKNSNYDYINDHKKWVPVKRAEIFDYKALMSNKISSEDWAVYSAEIEKVARLFLELNYDLLSQDVIDRLGLNDATRLTPVEVEDRIAEIIDTDTFARACDIENRFAKAEATRVKHKVELSLAGVRPKPDESERIKELRTILEQETAEVEERTQNIDKDSRIREEVRSRRPVKERDEDRVK